jgi:hypothetical protein
MNYGYIYLITLPEGSCGFNGTQITPFYIGQRSESEFDNRYWGSGTILHNWYRKHGANANSFQVPEVMERLGVNQSILVWAKNQEELDRLEAFFVDSILGTLGCLNLKGGGKGGKHGFLSRAKQSRTRKENPELVGLGTHYWTNGIVTIKRKEKPEGFTRGSGYDAFNKGKVAYTNGKINIWGSSDKCPDEFWRGVTRKKNCIGLKWFTDGKNIIRAYECPEGYRPGTGTGTHKNKICYTNGKENRYFESCPDGWWKGMTKSITTSHSKWYNNGKENVLSLTHPEGFVPGMLAKRTSRVDKK